MIYYEIIKPNNRNMAIEFIKNNWGSDIIVSRGLVHYAKDLEGFMALEDDKLCGLVTYRIDKSECEILTLDSLKEGCGIGTILIQKVIEVARNNNCTRVFLITSNDNIDAIRFYQKRRFDMVAVHRDAITEARKIKPQIPQYGCYDIEIKHEIEFEYKLN